MEKEIEKIENRLSKELPGKWKTLLSSRIDNRLLEFESELARQKDETEQIGKLKDVIDALDRRLNGDPCVTCGHIHNLPSLEEKDEISADIVSHQEKLEELDHKIVLVQINSRRGLGFANRRTIYFSGAMPRL